MKTLPIKIKAGDERVLLNGFPPKVDVRVISEDYYQELKKAYDSLQPTNSPECVKSSVVDSFCKCGTSYCVETDEGELLCLKCNNLKKQK